MTGPRWFFRVYGALGRMPGGHGSWASEMRHVLEQHAQKKMAVTTPRPEGRGFTARLINAWKHHGKTTMRYRRRSAGHREIVCSTRNR